jgi:hypothetical protein
MSKPGAITVRTSEGVSLPTKSVMFAGPPEGCRKAEIQPYSSIAGIGWRCTGCGWTWSGFRDHPQLDY